MRDLARLVQPHPLFSPWAARLACLYVDLGEAAEARAAFERLAARDFQGLASSGWWLYNLPPLAEACAELGDARRAAQLYDLFSPYAALCTGHEVFTGAAGHCLALLATTLSRWNEATTHFERALVLHRQIGAKPWLALSQNAFASALLERGESDDLLRARSLLLDAVALYDALGMASYAAKARTLLAQPKLATAQSTVAAYPNGLSAREVEVLRLVAAGKSNREIAAALAIAEGTVERYVSNLYSKIGARERANATAYAFRQQLVDPTAP